MKKILRDYYKDLSDKSTDQILLEFTKQLNLQGIAINEDILKNDLKAMLEIET
tara:strand:+ start:3568 stop:3726 length:159 start_codon:yes stop_codon:yes gene_type:complete